MIRLKLDIPVYKRHRITRKCFDGVRRIRNTFKRCGVDVMVYVATDDDAHNEMCVEYGFEHKRIHPQPLGRRLNELMDFTVCDYDYHMGLGSDDILADELCEILAAWMKRGAPIFGVSSMYAVNAHTSEVKKISQKLVFGAARCIRRDLIEQTGDLWEDYVMLGNDGNSQTRILQATGYGCQTVSTPEPLLYDIKSTHNLMQWDRFERYPTVKLKNYPPELKHYLK